MTANITKLETHMSRDQAEVEIVGRIKEVFYEYAGIITVSQVLGILRLIEIEMLEEHDGE